MDHGYDRRSRDACDTLKTSFCKVSFSILFGSNSSLKEMRDFLIGDMSVSDIRMGITFASIQVCHHIYSSYGSIVCLEQERHIYIHI